MTIRSEETDTLYTVADVQRVLQCGRTKAYSICSRELPTIKIGRSLRVTKKDLEAFIAENRHDR